MARSNAIVPQQSGWRLLASTITLAGWRLGQMWRLLMVTGLGIIATVVLVCSVPLFSEVATSAGLRSALGDTSGGEAFGAQIFSNQPSSSLIKQAGQQIDQIIHNNFGSYIGGSPQFSIQTPYLNILPSGPTTEQTGAGVSSSQIALNGYAMNLIASHATIVQGRLPQTIGRPLGKEVRGTSIHTIEIAVTQSTADNLGVKVGSVITVRLPSDTHSVIWTLHVVGIFAPVIINDTFWHDTNDFQPQLQTATILCQALTSSDALISVVTATQLAYAQPFILSWNYQLDLSRFNGSDIDTVLQQTQTMEQQIPNTVGSLPFVQSAMPSGSIFSTLPLYATQVRVVEIPVTVLLIMVVGLVLFFVSIMSDVLVDRQAAIIALLRSRSASRGLVFGTFAAQGFGLGLLALIGGPLLSVLLVRLIAQVLLPSSEQDALNVIAGNPVQAALHVGWFALFAVTGAIIAMIVAINRASGLDILMLRQEASRKTRRSLWRRLNLDIIASILVFAGYAEYTFAQQSLGSQAKILLGPLSFIAPLLLLVAGILLFLRFFPVLIRSGTRLASHRRGAPAMLALVQMDRSPRSASRIILLLALSTAFVIFALTFMASQEQRVFDAAAYRVGADFSGKLPFTFHDQTLADETAAYLHIPGVTSITIGYRSSFTPPNIGGLPVQLIAVDANPFSRTALWTKQDSLQPLSSLTALLAAHRTDALSRDTVYAIVDASLWNTLDLSPGASFTMPLSEFTGRNMHFIAAAEVQNIPDIYDGPPDGSGFLVDYQSYATVYTKDTAGTGVTISPNYAWLQTKDDPASLVAVRNALSSGSLQLSNLLDRRVILSNSQGDPLQVNVIGVLCIGVGVAVILALVGTLVTAWLSASSRLTNFAVLRALGMGPRQIAIVLAWEQGIIYSASIVLGIVLGIILIAVVVPILVFTNAISGVAFLSSLEIPPLQTVVPMQQLAIIFGMLVVICSISLVIMASVVSRPSLSQTLRLNED